MNKNFIFKFVFSLMALIFVIACEECNECPNKFEARFRFVDNGRNEILSDNNLLILKDLNQQPYPVIRSVVEQDTFYLANLQPTDLSTQGTDTLVFVYDNNVIDTASVSYTFSSDSRCCKNFLTVDRLNFFNFQTARRIKPQFTIYDVIID